MRLPLFAAILALLPLPALADVTARYSTGKQALLVEIDDGGNTRIGVEGKGSILRREGVDYFVLVTPDGQVLVVELGDLVTLVRSAIAAKPKESGEFPDKFLLESKGEAMVGERRGVLWNFGPAPKPDGTAEKMLEVVMSDDPALAPIAAVFRHSFEALLPLLGAAMPETSGFTRLAAELLAKGAPLRIEKEFALQSLVADEIDPKRFELPAPVTSAAELMRAVDYGANSTIELKPLP